MKLTDELRRNWQAAHLLSICLRYHSVKLVANTIDGDEGVMEQQIARLMCRRLLDALKMSVEVRGEEHLRGLERYHVCSNHLSYLDWVVLLAAFPSPLRFIAKQEVTLFPVLGSYLKNRGVLIDRSKGRDARTAIASALAEDSPWPLLLFPEGTRSPDGELKPFKPGGIRLLAASGDPLVPVVLLATDKAFAKSDRAIRKGHRLGLEILPPVRPEDHDGPEAMAVEVERRVAEGYANERSRLQ